jgi:hypothetical protein
MWIVFHRELVKPDYAITPDVSIGGISEKQKKLFHMVTPADVDASPYTPCITAPGIWEYQATGGAPLEAINVNPKRLRAMFSHAYRWSRRRKSEDGEPDYEMTEFFEFMANRESYIGVMDFEWANMLTDVMARARDEFFETISKDRQFNSTQRREWYDLWYDFCMFADRVVCPKKSYIRFTDERPPFQGVD